MAGRVWEQYALCSFPGRGPPYTFVFKSFNYYSVVGYPFTSSLWYVGQYLARLYNVWRSLLGEIAIARFD